jgi:hypothetical protein
MTVKIVVTGTDTGIGKTVFAAGLTRLLDGCYWKPVQAGLDGESNSVVARWPCGLSADRVPHPACFVRGWRECAAATSPPADPCFNVTVPGMCCLPQRTNASNTSPSALPFGVSL